MADVIDEKVVSMQFDNKQFEKGVAESLKSIQELKDSLDFDQSVKNLDTLAQAGKKFDFSGVSNAVDTVKEKFSALEIVGVTALVNITNQAVNAGKNMVAALTVDPVKVGLSTYEQKLNSVQTIMNNSGKSLAETNKILDALNDYSDKTIFSLSDMTTALGKFTAAGIDAADAVTIIKGAANEAATMGAGSAEFSRFIYNLSQAYSVGKMTMLDWKSLENAGIAGVKFKQSLVDAARELGTINDEFEKKHGVVTATNLREFLKEGIITNEVMTKAFNLYADTTTDFGRAAEAAATQIKTFHQLLDVLKESVASKWSQAWTYIIGDFNEAKKLWTGVSALFEATLGKINDNRNQLLKLWHEGFRDPVTDKTISGRKYLLDGIANILQSIARLIKPVKDAFREIFPAKTAQNLWEATKAFSEFTAKMRISSGAMKQIKDFAAGIFSVMRLVRDTFWDVIKAIFPATEGINGMLSLILRLAGAFGRWLQSVTTAIRENTAYRDTIQAIGSVVTTVVKIIAVLAKTLFNVGKAAKETGLLQKAFTLLATAVAAVFSVIMRYGPKVLNLLGGIAQVVMSVIGIIFGGFSKVANFFKNLFPKKDGNAAINQIKNVTDSMGELAKYNSETIGENIIAGVGIGMVNGAKTLTKTTANIFGSVITTTEDVLDEHSPSKVFMTIGAFCLLGFVMGLKDSAIGNKIKSVLTDVVNSDIISGFRESLRLGFQRMGNLYKGLFDGIANLGKKARAALWGVKETEDELVESTGEAAGSIGGLLNRVVGWFKQINGAALLMYGVVAAASIALIKLIQVAVNVTSFMNEAGHGFRKIVSSFKTMAKAFKNISKAFLRAQNPVVNTIYGIAAALIAFTAALWVLSSIDSQGKLWSSMFALVVGFGLILAEIGVLAGVASKMELEESLANIAKVMLSFASSVLIVAGAFALIVVTLSSLNGDYKAAWMGLVMIGSIVAMLFVLTLGLKRVNTGSALTATIALLVFSLALGRIISSFAEMAKQKFPKNIMKTTILPLLALMGGMALLGIAMKNVKVGSALMILVMIALLKKVIEASKDIDWSGVLDKLESMQVFLAILAVSLVGMIFIAAMTGPRLKKFGEGMLSLMGCLAIMTAVVFAIQALGLNTESLKIAAIMAGIVAGFASVLAIVMSFTKVPKGKLAAFGVLINMIGLVMLSLAKACVIVEENMVYPETILSMGAVLVTFAGVLGVLAYASKFTKDAKMGSLVLMVGMLALTMLAIGHLAKVYSEASEGGIGATIASIVIVLGSLIAISVLMKNIKEDAAKPMRALVGSLLVLLGGLILLTMVPIDRMLSAALSLGGVMVALMFLMNGMSKLDKGSLGPAIVAAVDIVIVAAALAVLANMCDWNEVIMAAVSLGIAMIAVSASIAIIAKAAGGLNAMGAAVSIVIAASALFILAYALQELSKLNLKWDENMQVITGAFVAVVAALGILGAIGPLVLAGAAAIVAGVWSLQLLATGLSALMETNVDGGYLLKLAGCMLALGLAGVVLGLGASGIVVGSLGLLILAKSLQMFAEAGIGGGYLTGLGASLMMVGLGGVVLGLGAPGLILGGIGMLILASGLRILSGVNTKVINGKTLTGISAGLMMLGLAGVVLGLGAAGLIIGGIGLVILAGGLALMDNLNYKALSKKNLIGLGEGLIKIATAGIVGIIGGPGLILLSVGLTALAGAITVVGLAIEGLLGLMKVVGDIESVNIGANVVAGMIKGMTSMTGALMSSITFIFGGMLNGIRDFLGIHSPSTALEELGEWSGLGFLKGWAKSDLVQKLDKVSESIAIDGILKPLSGTLSEGFGNISDIFSGADFGFGDMFKSDTADLEKELQQQKDLYNNLIKGRYSFYRKNPNAKAQENYERRIGTVAQRIADIEKKIAESEANSVDGLFGGLSNGVDGLAEMFSGLKDALNGTDFEMSGMSVDANSLAGSLGDLNTASAATTKTFAENMDIFSDFDRSLKTTVNDIESNMINQLLGTDQWAKYLNNLRAYGYDPELIAEIADKGMQSGYNIAAALNAAGTNFEKVQEINDIYRKDKHEYAEAAQKAEEDAKNLAKSGAKAEQNLKDVVVTSDMMNGDISKISNNLENQDILKELLGQGYEEYLEGAKFEDYLKRLQGDQAATEKLREEQEAAQEKASQTTADAMMKDMAGAIENAVNKYLPASEFVKIGENICLGLTAGIIMGKGMTVNEVVSLCDLLKKAAMGTLDEHSPSKVFKQIGNYCVEGLALGLQDSTDATKSARYLSQNLIDEMNEQLAKIQKLIESDEVWSPTIKPVVDLSNMPSNMLDFGFDTSHIRAAAQSLSGFEFGAKAPADTMASMSKSDFARFLNDFANTIVEGINNGEKTITVPITIKNDPHKQFTAMVDENNAYKHATGYSAFV